MDVDNNKIETIMRFYLLATKLKYKIRSGWNKEHWNIDSDRLESIAEHVYGCLVLTLGIYSEYRYKIDINKVMMMLVLHEIGEVFIPDITPFMGISREEKMLIEHEAMASVLDGLLKKEEYLSLLYEFDEGKTVEAKFAYMIDKIEADIQSKVYQDMGCHHSLCEQENNITFKNDSVLKMVEDGAESAFDIWYLFDRDKFEREPTFSKILKYVKDNDLNI